MSRPSSRKRPAVTAVSRAAIACPLGSCRVLVAPASGWPLGVDARVSEQDTWFLMGDSDRLELPARVDPGALADSLRGQQPVVPGQLATAGGRPEQLYAVVYDVDAEPVTRPEWLQEAWAHLAERARRKRWQALAAPLLGAAHSRLGVDELVGALRAGWHDIPPPALRRFWLLVPSRMSATGVARRLAAG